MPISLSEKGRISLGPHASPRLVGDIKESACARDDLEKNRSFAVNGGSLRIRGSDSPPRFTARSYPWQRRVGGCDGHQGAVLFQQGSRGARWFAGTGPSCQAG